MDDPLSIIAIIPVCTPLDCNHNAAVNEATTQRHRHLSDCIYVLIYAHPCIIQATGLLFLRRSTPVARHSIYTMLRFLRCIDDALQRWLLIIWEYLSDGLRHQYHNRICRCLNHRSRFTAELIDGRVNTRAEILAAQRKQDNAINSKVKKTTAQVHILTVYDSLFDSNWCRNTMHKEPDVCMYRIFARRRHAWWRCIDLDFIQEKKRRQHKERLKSHSRPLNCHPKSLVVCAWMNTEAKHRNKTYNHCHGQSIYANDKVSPMHW